MAAKASEPRRSLREQAAELGRGKPGYKSRIDILLDSLPAGERDEVLDLLRGEPLLPHGAVAAILVKNFPDLAMEPQIKDRNVMDWRRSRAVYLRQRLADEG